MGVAVSGNYAYVADNSRGLRIINIANPAAPTEAGSYDTWGYALGVAVSGNYAYVAIAFSGLRIINIENPAAPTLAGFYYDTPGVARGVAVSGNYAYVADGESGLGIYDISFFAPCPVPRAPDSLVVQFIPTSNVIKLKWSPVTLDTSGAPIVIDRYVVFRSANPGASWDSLGVPTPPDTTLFLDFTATGERGFYQVRAEKD